MCVYIYIYVLCEEKMNYKNVIDVNC